MFKNFKRAVKFGSVTALLVLGICTMDSQTRKADATPASAAEAALPSPDELPGFANGKTRSGAKGSKRVRARRNSDAAQIDITTVVASNAEEAHKLVLMAMSSNSNGLLSDAPSGRKIGEECWRSRYQPGKPPTGGFELIARDGRSVVIATITLQVDKSKSGAAIQRPLKVQDLQLVERQVVNCLSKLTATGYTSKSKK